MKVRIFHQNIDANLLDLKLPAELIQIYYNSDGIFEIESLESFLDAHAEFVKIRKTEWLVWHDEKVHYWICIL